MAEKGKRTQKESRKSAMHLRVFDSKENMPLRGKKHCWENVQTVGATENQTETCLISLPESFLIALWFPNISRAF